MSNLRPYEKLLQRVLTHGERTSNRTGIDTLDIFGAQIRYNLSSTFPLITSKRVPFRWVAEELFWFLSGSTDEKELQARGVDIWKEWATPEQCARFGRDEGDLGPVYGHQWRNFGATEVDGNPHLGRDYEKDEYGYYRDGVDQIKRVVEDIKKNPASRRHIVTGWNPAEADRVALPPCHTLFQFYVINGKLSCHLYQRSADLFLGVPFNIASYALLTCLIAKVTALTPGDLVTSYGSAHIYVNHLPQCVEVVRRETLDPRPFPVLFVANKDSLFNYGFNDIGLHDYDPHPKLEGQVAV